MRLLLSKLSQQGGATARQSQQVDVSTVTIGRATDQLIHSLDSAVALKHAVIGLSSGKLTIRSLAKTGVIVNGSPAQRAELRPGDTVEIGNLTVSIENEEPDDAANGIDARIAVLATAVEVSSEELDARYALNLGRAGLKNRRWAWAWALGVLALFMVIPLLSPLLIDKQPELVEQLRASPLPSDSAWLSGPLHKSHKFIGDNCEACHAEPFKMVRDQECMACHSNIRHHADPAEFATPELDSVRCAVCHQSHHEPSALVNGDEKLCVDCHNNFDEQFADSSLQNVSSFLPGEDTHPQLRVTMLQPGGKAPLWVSLDDPDLKDPSGLKFPHDKHLNAEGIISPSGKEVLECDSCHVTDRGGHSMLTVNFEQHCQSCHVLDFDADLPDRQVPHGDPKLVMSTLREFYAARYIEQLDAAVIQPADGRQRPGRAAREAAELAAFEKADRVAQELFSKRSCAVCHAVEQTDDGWQVAPVKLTEVWMPRAAFTHEPHSTSQCIDCHAADTSSEASDVLMPKLDNCQTCHGDSDSTGLLQTGCIGCHGFHNSSMPLMRQAETPLPDDHHRKLMP